MTEFDREAFEDALIGDLRANGGRASGGPMAGQALVVLYSKGARTGASRRAILTPSRDAGDYVVAGSASGSPKNPAWLANLRASPNVTIEADGKSLAAVATITVGAERDRLWQQHVAALPHFAEYPRQTGRVIPMVRLRPTP